MYRVSNHKQGRIQHLASLGWLLQDDALPLSTANQYNQSIQYSLESHKHLSPPRTPTKEEESKLRALSLDDKVDSAANSPQ